MVKVEIKSILIGMCLCFSSFGTYVEIDPGEENTSFFYNSFNMPGVLSGTELNGQTISLDFVFSDKKIASAKKIEIVLSIAQGNEIGYRPDKYSTVTGYLTDNCGVSVSEFTHFHNCMTVSAQIWPNTGYTLPDGKEYLPAKTGYSSLITGTQPDYLTFSGIHFDIKTPVTFSDEIIGLRMSLSNYHDYDEKTNTWLNPIHISQRQVSSVPEPSVVFIICLNLIACAFFFKLPGFNRKFRD